MEYESHQADKPRNMIPPTPLERRLEYAEVALLCNTEIEFTGTKDRFVVTPRQAAELLHYEDLSSSEFVELENSQPYVI